MGVSILQLLQMMMQQKGSDLHIASQSPAMIRIRGEVIKVDMAPFTAEDVEGLVTQVTNTVQRNELLKNKSVDFAFKASGVGIFRVNVFYQRHGLSLVVRSLSEAPPEIDALGLPSICKKACSFSNGLVLVTGPTGSGKSTTLAAMINYINQNERGHILTLEDPIEFQHETKMSMVNQRALGIHFTDFSTALKASLREDPDVILVGEMRDLETVALAIKAAETGHLVFSTLHTNSASKTVDRIIDSFPADEQSQIRAMLSESLRVVISQKLVPSADRKRRICIHDILVNTPAVGNLIREGKTFQIPSVMQTGRQEGMQVFDRVLLDYVQKGEITGEVAWENANDKPLFAQYMPKQFQTQPVANNSSSSTTNGGTPGNPNKKSA